MQNISSPQTTSASQSKTPINGNEAQGGVAKDPEMRPGTRDRATLEVELLEAMTAFSPRDRGVLKNWHRHSISLVHLNVLTSLEAEGPLSMKRLADSMDISDASATGIVDRMEKRGLVERRHDASDRRVVMVYPTDTGSQLFREMDTHRHDFLVRVFAELTDEELAACLTGMRAVQAAGRHILNSIAEAHAGPGEPDRANPAAHPPDAAPAMP
jgi:MarR family 2-MHQ and catechol resistance regulon transcriptional repressor